MHRITSLLLLTGILLVSSSAFAQDPFALSLGIGLKGGINGSGGVGVPENATVQFGNTIYEADPDIYPSGGVGGAIGLHLDLRVMDLVGLESGLHLSYDYADGYEDKNINGVVAGTDNQTQRTTALHIPLMFKIWVPGVIVRPVFGLGVQFVLQQDSTLEHDNAGGRYITNPRDIETSNYTLAMLSAGLEFEVLYVRIPLEFRFGYNMNFSNTAEDRVRYEGNTIQAATVVYDGAYQMHAGLFIGIIYDYDFLF